MGAQLLINRSENRHHDARLDQAIRFALENIAETISLMDLARVAKMSRFCFCRRFHRLYGKTPMRWFWEIRTILAMEMIIAFPGKSLTDVAFACGFGSSAHFSRAFRSQFGLSPSEMRELAMTSDLTAVRQRVFQEGTYGDER
jgi:AraC family transcriptional regulator